MSRHCKFSREILWENSTVEAAESEPTTFNTFSDEDTESARSPEGLKPQLNQRLVSVQAQLRKRCCDYNLSKICTFYDLEQYLLLSYKVTFSCRLYAIYNFSHN
ncbi:unnamed protein product [Ceratitis capitata]|uniref:(Mediterranean fruit fly) hypothetical protein n=1 Tax=Ceratitis capitata TaxID=7213 RepID=A0A811V6A6_CERCA|nr:unnamed protein product [Ceratitis capitata]